MKSLAALCLFFVAGGVFAEPSVEPAKIGVPLDVAKTISIIDTSQVCGVVPVQWLYKDSQGGRHVASYQVMGSGCND